MSATINRSSLFIASCMALVVTSMTFAIRAALMDDFTEIFSLSNEEVGWVTGTAFWGFTLAMVFGGPLVDIIGMKRFMGIAFGAHVLGVLVTIFASGFWTLFIGTLLIGIANGTVEAVCNPLVATLYPEDKTKKLNQFHVWFPGGIVIGSIIAYFMLDQGGMDWRLLMGVLLIPAAVYGYLFFKEDLPVTERVASGISTGDMFKEVLKPLFLFMVLCMLLTAATELGTNQQIENLLKSNEIVPGIVVLAFISGIMALGRYYAGPIVHRLAPTGMLLFSAIFSLLGLIWLSYASGYVAFAAAAVFAIGITYFWPTMLGFVAEYMPKSGALGLAIMGGAGMLSVSIVLPVMGRIMDDTLKTNPDMVGPITLRYMAILPAILIVLFGLLYMYMQRRKGKTEAQPA